MIPNNLNIIYYDNGKVQEIREVDEYGNIHGLSMMWYMDGKRKKETYYHHDKLHGPSRQWRRNGRILEELTWINGEKHGKYSLWCASGQKWEETYYDHGKLHGVSVNWHSYGEVERIRYYSNHHDITPQILKIVNNIRNMTNAEKTLIALQFGIVP
jgi:antitoxin component YwqK of YwqJK toxin-antitoxin module